MIEETIERARGFAKVSWEFLRIEQPGQPLQADHAVERRRSVDPAERSGGSEIDAALAHGANHLVTLVAQAMELLSASGAEDPAATLRPLLTAALEGLVPDNDQGEYYLTDAVGTLVRDGRRVEAFTAPDPVEVHGVNDRAQAVALGFRRGLVS